VSSAATPRFFLYYSSPTDVHVNHEVRNTPRPNGMHPIRQFPLVKNSHVGIFARQCTTNPLFLFCKGAKGLIQEFYMFFVGPYIPFVSFKGRIDVTGPKKVKVEFATSGTYFTRSTSFWPWGESAIPWSDTMIIFTQLDMFRSVSPSISFRIWRSTIVTFSVAYAKTKF
jgi:hypothetical protein